jgi:replicative DNA helicase
VYRRLIEIASRIAQMGYAGEGELEDTLARSESMLSRFAPASA